MCCEPSPRVDGFAPWINAALICAAVAFGNAFRNSAAAPETVGAENDVPDTSENEPRNTVAGHWVAVRPLQFDWANVAKPLAVRSGLAIPSASGPRELK